MGSIDEEFARIVGSVEQEIQERYIWREGDQIRVALPRAVCEAVQHVAQLVAMHAADLDVPAVYDDQDEQLTYQLLHTDSIRSVLAEACAVVERTAFDSLTDEASMHAWIQVLNHAKFLAVESLEATASGAHDADEERRAFIQFLGAVQHEVLQALL
jgi:hypothetical protein